MTFNDFIKNDEYEKTRKWFDDYIYVIYNSPRGYFLKNNMEIDDFKNEIYIRLLKNWCIDKFDGKLKSYLATATKYALLNLYEKMDTDKNSINYDNTIERLDKEVSEGNAPIEIECNDNLFDEMNCIEYIIKGIDVEIDKEIIRLFLHGVPKKDIERKLHVSRTFVRHRIENKYNKLMKTRFNEYVNSY